MSTDDKYDFYCVLKQKTEQTVDFTSVSFQMLGVYNGESVM
jgi:hypothetical protein